MLPGAVTPRMGGWRTASICRRYNITSERDLIAASEKIEASRQVSTPADKTSTKTDTSAFGADFAPNEYAIDRDGYARKRHEVKRSGYSYRRCLQRITSRERQAETVLPIERFLDSNRMHFSEALSKLAQSTFTFCSPIGSPTSRGFCTVKRRRFNDLGEMKACLQSRCSPS
jgi:hypothetical protein